MSIKLSVVRREIFRGIGLLIGSLLYVTSATLVQAAVETAETDLVRPEPEWVGVEKLKQVVNELRGVREEVVEEVADVGCDLAQTFAPEVLRWEEKVCQWSEEYEMDPDIIATIMQIESCGDPSAVSATGVRGLFQVTGANLDGEDPFNPDVSMAKGPGKVLKAELKAADNQIVAAFAGYNGGGFARDYVGGKISRYQFYWRLRNHPSGYWWSRGKAEAKINEVEHYAHWANIYFEAKEGRQDTLNEWLEAGGSRLCEASKLVDISQFGGGEKLVSR